MLSNNPIPESHFEQTLQQLRTPYGLKEISRAAVIGNRKESVTEHVGSMLFLASWFMRTYELGLDTNRVIDLICFHDLSEKESGCTPIIPGVDNRAEKEIKEAAAIKVIALSFVPKERQYFMDTISEYKAGLTPESKFVQAIDKLDADLQFLGDKEAWATWSDEFYRSKREPYYKEVPAIYEFYKKLLDYLHVHAYLQS